MTQSERDELIVNNQRFVYLLYHRLGQTPLVVRNRDDLISEGMWGLVRCARYYKPSLGFKFTTYAAYYINDAFYRYLRKLRKQEYSEVSLDAPIVTLEDDSELTLADMLPARDNVERQTMLSLEWDNTERSASPKELAIAKRLHAGQTQTEIARHYGVSRQRIGQIVKQLRERRKII